MRTVYGDHERFVETYFSTYPGKYFTGDGCRRDADGYYWITGRVDDVINVSGHRMGTAEVESALVAHPKVAEAAVVGYPARHQGPGHLRLCDPDGGRAADRGAAQGAGRRVRKEIGPIASPDLIQFAPGLPKTRSGKIMRRILRKIAEDEFGSLGDTSTLADPAVLVKNRQNKKGAGASCRMSVRPGDLSHSALRNRNCGSRRLAATNSSSIGGTQCCASRAADQIIAAADRQRADQLDIAACRRRLPGSIPRTASRAIAA
jgi:hypothetical protein